MPKSPKENEIKMMQILNGWKTLAPEKEFGGMTFAEYQSLVNASLAPRQRLIELEDEKLREQEKRDAADEITMDKIQFIVNGVLADQTEGPNSALYESFGYIRKDERKSGLTRKKKQPATPAP